MPDKRTHPVWLEDVESSPSDLACTRLCVVSGQALPSREFIAAIRTAIGPNEEIQVIQDRRQGGSGTAPAQPLLDRRRHPHVDAMVKKDGYAIVPSPTSQPARVPEPRMRSRLIERTPDPWPTERLRSEPLRLNDDTDTDDRALESSLQFKRRRSVQLGPLLLLTVLGVVLGVLLTELPAMKPLISGPTSPPVVATTSAPGTGSPLGSASLPTGRADSSEPDRPKDAASLPPAPPGHASRSDAGPVPGPRTSALDGDSPGPPSRPSSRPGRGARAPELVRPPDMRRSMARWTGLPHVEFVRNPLPTAGGKAGSYVVRVSDPAGRPLPGAEVLLLARMADGTVENVMLDAGPEPGTYTGTSRFSPSAPVNLRVRMTLSDKRIEIPVRP